MSELGSDSEEEEAESSASSSAGNSAVFEGANTAVASKSSGLGAGPIVGIVIGSAAIIGLISWIILYQVTKNKRGLSSANYLDIDKHGPGQDPYGSKVDLITTAAELAHMGRR
ncbi:hypothetical protein FBU59_004015 [Linderina macrospora]|uniref:Uncharacterized protein n=1 Tax=Linderina macrospora TaxID=4868 RepID=A0ACC1J6Z4_9FUNG|nr:hypothetical protein FBU59_004015 [Linderina macrospora]